MILLSLAMGVLNANDITCLYKKQNLDLQCAAFANMQHVPQWKALCNKQ